MKPLAGMRQCNRLRKRILVSLLFASLAAGCSYRREKGSPDGADASAIQPSAEQLANSSFSLVYTTVLQPHCISCHGTSGGVNLETYSSAVSVLARIKARAIDTRQMPKAPEAPLSIPELQVLNAWIQTGGRENPENGPPPPLP
ncbi:MAG: hypothetical protein ACXVCK_01725, partial [Bdellovibrionota bacterium]